MNQQLHKYSVFISSGGSVELRALLDVCVQSTWDAGHAARALLTPAARLGIREEIQQADIIVRLCRRLDDSVRSECFWALDANKPYLLFMLGTEDDRPVAENLLATARDGSAFRLVSADPESLAKDFLITLTQAIRSLDASSSVSFWAEQTLDQCLRNPFWRRFAARANEWATLDWRFNTNAPLKKAAAESFLDLYLDTLSRSSVCRLFFESGSSTAFMSEAFASRLDQGIKWSRLSIETNNILSYMEFILGRSAPVALFPVGPPDRKYGGTFGELMSLSIPPEGAYPISGEAYELMAQLRDHFSKQYSESGLIISTASGFDLTRGSEWIGPHVGSYHNMLFKRALLESGAPVVIVMDEDKLLRPREQSRCFPVCNADFSWYFACQNMPIALACAFRSEERANRVIPDLQYLGLEHLEFSRHGEAPWPIVASNNMFWERRRGWIEEALQRAPQDMCQPHSLTGRATSLRHSKATT
jgi:hypothetical protein